MDYTLGVRRLISATVLLAMAIVLNLTGLSPVHAAIPIFSMPRPVQADEEVVFWHIPHPDDETLGMAGGMIAAANEGKRNIVVMYTEGKASDVRLVLNGVIYCTLHNRFHRPHREGYEPLDKDAFGRARMLETTMALHALGVDEADILSVGLPDGGVTIAAAYDVMQALDAAFPAAAHRTTTLSDAHSDHRNLARALNRLVQHKRSLREEPDVKFHSVYIYRSPEARRAATLSPLPVPDSPRKRRALDEFAVWAPEAGRFAIGMHSVPQLITNAAADSFEYVTGVPATLKARHLRAPLIAFNVLSDQAALQWRLAPSLFARLGFLYSGGPAAAALFYEAPTFVNAFEVRLGVAPTLGQPSSRRSADIGLLAALRIFDHLLVEYRPETHAGGRPGPLVLGVKFTL